MKKFASLAITLIAILLIPKNTNAQCHTDDWTALKALYNSTNGASWINRSGWNIHIAPYNNPQTSCNLGDLHGVSLDAYGRVFNLILDNNNLSGLLPSQIGSLENINQLWLRFNQIGGDIPEEIGGLSNLTTLSLLGNQFTGNIPNSIYDLTLLETLNLGSNNLTGYISYTIQNLNNLRSLYLHNNLFSNLITPHIGDLNNLEILHLHQNEFDGVIPASFGTLSNLNELLLHDNKFSGSIDAVLGNLTNLNVLRIDNNELEGCYSNNLNAFCSIATNAEFSNGNNFEASWENFCNTGTSGLCSGCNIDDWNALKALYESTDGDNWTIRTGWDTQINGLNSPPANCNLEELHGVFLGYNDRVKYLYLENNNLYGVIPTGIGDLERAIQVNLSNNQLIGNIPKEIDEILYLELIWLNNNQLTGAIPEELASSFNLNNVRLENNFLSGTIPFNFGGINNIRHLSLQNNSLNSCYHENLTSKCNIATNLQISNGNNFDASWEDFCNNDSGVCAPCSFDNCSANIDTRIDFFSEYPPGLGGGGGFCAGTGAELKGITDRDCIEFIDWTIISNGTNTTNFDNYSTLISLPVSGNIDQTFEVCATINYSNGDVCSPVCDTYDLFCAPFVPETNVTVDADFIRVHENTDNPFYYVVRGLTQNYAITGEDEFGNTVQTFNTNSNQDVIINFYFDFHVRAIRIQHLNNPDIRFRNCFK